MTGRPDPAPIRELGWAFARSAALAAAVELRLFNHLASGPATAAEVAAAAGTSPRGTRMLLDALVALELLEREGGGYRLTPVAACYLVEGRPDYLGASFQVLQEGDEDPWDHLADCVRSGRPWRAVDEDRAASSFFPRLVTGLHITYRDPARRTAAFLLENLGRRGPEVLDVGAGSGVWGIALAEADPEARVTALDFPAMLDVTRDYAGRHGLLERFAWLPGDLREVELGTARFDVAILGNIAHSAGEAATRGLLRRLHEALRPGGLVAIADMVPADDRRGPPYPLLFALNMLLHTEQGDVFTTAQYREWFAAAGFAETRTADIGSHSPLVVGVRG